MRTYRNDRQDSLPVACLYGDSPVGDDLSTHSPQGGNTTYPNGVTYLPPHPFDGYLPTP